MTTTMVRAEILRRMSAVIARGPSHAYRVGNGGASVASAAFADPGWLIEWIREMRRLRRAIRCAA